jgi:lysozyme
MADINIDELNDAISDLNRTMRDLTATLGSYSETSVKATRSTKNQGEETNKVNQALDGLGRTTKGLTEAELARIEAQKRIRESEMHLKDATDSAKKAIGSFAGALLDNQVKLTNYGATLGKVGDAALSLGKSFGGLGIVVGGLIKGLTVLGEAQLKQAQSTLDAKDQLTKIGGAGAHTTKSILDMAHQADLNSETLERMVKPMQGLGSSIMVLGNNAGSAQKEFAKLIQATDEERAMFSRLGMTQEDMMKGSADYIALQAMSGRSIKNELSDREKLRKSTQDYQLNLLDLATITGKDVEELKKKQQEALRDRQLMIDNAMMENKARKLEAEGRTEEAAAIRREIEARQAGLGAMVDAPKELQKGIKEIMTTGSIAGKDAQVLARMGLEKEAQAFQDALKTGDTKKAQEASMALQQAYAKRLTDNLDGLGEALKVGSDELSGQFGVTTESLEWANKQRDRNLNQELDSARKNRTEAGKEGDKASDARAMAQNATIAVTKGLDQVVAATNPLIAGFTGLTAAVGAATIAVGVLAAKAMGGKAGGMVDAAKGVIGNITGRAAPAMTTVATAAPAAGAAMTGATSAASKNAAGVVENLGQGGGNMLQGAAKGLAAFANPQVVLGAAGLGAAITAIGAGIAGATWILGKALPSLMEGLQSFEKIDGDKLVKSGKGIAALGGGLAVFSAGGVAAGFGAIASSIGEGLAGFFGAKTPFQKIEEFSKLNIDADKVENNARAFTAFGKAMAVTGGGGAASGIGTAVSAIGDAIGSFFKSKPPVDKMKEFAAIDLGTDGAKRIKDNADAFITFSKAMQEFKGSSGPLSSGLMEGISNILKNEPPVEQMKKFASIDLGPDGAKKVKGNAQAFVYFSRAMSEYKGSATEGLTAGINKAVSGFFELEPPVEQMKKFAAIDLGTDGAKKVKENAEAFGTFADAMSKYKGTATDGVTAGINKVVSDFFQIQPPLEQLKNFAAIDGLDTKKVKNNAQAFVYFSRAMAEYKGGATPSISESIAQTVSSYFQVDPPVDKMVAFAQVDIGGEEGVKKVKLNADAFVAFSNAMSQYKGGGELKNAVDSMIGGITKMFGGDDVMSKFVKFTKLDVDPEKASKLALAFARYAKGLQLASGGAISAPGGGAPSGGGAAPAAKPAGAAPAGGGGGAAPAAAPASGGGATGASSGGGFLSKVASALGFGDGDKGAGAQKDTSGATSAPPVVAQAKGGAGGTMSEQEAKDMTMRHEGVRYEPYKDSLGLWTVGVGHLIGDGRSLPPEYNRKFSHEEVMAMYDKDYEKHKKQAQSNVPGFSKFDSVGQAALIDLTFNMGPGWPKKFPNTSKKLAAGDTEGAARGLEDSLWYQQVKSRGPTIVSMVENSKVSARDGGLAMGPQTGYPATLHGNEMIVPLDPNSILADMGKKSMQDMQAQIEQKTNQIQSMDPEVFKELAHINQSMMDMLSTKLDSMIDKLDTSNSTQDKLLRYSQA